MDIDSVQVLNIDAERGSKVLGREKQFNSGAARASGFEDDQTAQDEDFKDDVECPNCKELIPGPEAGTHTITCFRNSTKCKVCKEVILKAKKREHLEQWRD